MNLDQLSKHCCTETVRYAFLSRPFAIEHGGVRHTVASDAKSAVIVQEDFGAAPIPADGPVQTVHDAVFPAGLEAVGDYPLADLKQFVGPVEQPSERKCESCNGTGGGECEECDGTGYEVCDLGHDHRCSECGGKRGHIPCADCKGKKTSIQPPEPRDVMLFGGRFDANRLGTLLGCFDAEKIRCEAKRYHGVSWGRDKTVSVVLSRISAGSVAAVIMAKNTFDESKPDLPSFPADTQHNWNTRPVAVGRE